VLICLYLRLTKENFLTADDNGWTQIQADEDHRDLNNSDPNNIAATALHEPGICCSQLRKSVGYSQFFFTSAFPPWHGRGMFSSFGLQGIGAKL
jgi:hypothetical protein